MLQKAALIGIIGGMGPEAGRILHGLIIEETKKVRLVAQDQDHCNILHFSLPSLIPDRATYIFDQSQKNPVDVIIQIVKSMALVAEKFNSPIKAIIPCNTFHAPILYDDLKHRIVREQLDKWVHLHHFVNDTVLEIVEKFPHVQQIGLLSTSGTRKTAIYANALTKRGLILHEVPQNIQETVDDAIYNPTDGLKALSKASDRVKKLLENCVHSLKDQGAEKVILGCTEFPLAFETESNILKNELIDPMRLIAQRLINYVL